MNYEYCNGYTYTIKQGDTLYEISRKKNVPLAILLRANPFVDVFNLQIGDTLCIPTPPEASAPGFGRPGGGTPDFGGPDFGFGRPGYESSEEGTQNNGGMQDDENSSWIRYVVQPGDTLSELVREQEILGDFVQKNGLENIYLLPGVAYYVPER